MSVYSEGPKGFAAGDAAAKSGTRPAFITDEHLEYLDGLRKSGATNMFGARPYVTAQFSELTVAQAAEVLSYWMHTFGKETR